MVSPDTTRMLVLGVTQIFEPANGYQLRRELLSWQVEQWANINPGSIYSMLSTLTKQGMVTRTDIVTVAGTRPVAIYMTTEAGRQEQLRLVRAGLLEVHAFDQSGFYAALSLMITLLSRDEIVELLETRRATLEAATARNRDTVRGLDASRAAPPHVPRLMEYSSALQGAESAWITDFIAQVGTGKMTFAGEDGMQQWDPAPDDPAWRMVREREAYRRTLGLDA